MLKKFHARGGWAGGLHLQLTLEQGLKMGKDVKGPHRGRGDLGGGGNPDERIPWITGI